MKQESTYGLRGSVVCKLAHGSDPASKKAVRKWLDGVRVTIQAQWAGVRDHGPLKRWTYRIDDIGELTLVRYTISDDN